MKTPITYYGGKQRLASEIISMMPPHDVYVEPFFGGGAVFFKKLKAGIEVINDHDKALMNFYHVVQNNYDELKIMIENTLCSESMYLIAKDIWNERVDATDIEKAWSVWMITNGSYAGSMHGGWKWCNGTSGSHTGIFIRNKRSDFQKKIHERLEDVQISCRDAIKVIDDRDSTSTFFYLDPPYPGSYQGHYAGYSHEDLVILMNKLSEIKGKFILSNYMSEVLQQAINDNGWNYRSIQMNLKLSNLGRRKKKSDYRTEILVYNFDIYKTLFD